MIASVVSSSNEPEYSVSEAFIEGATPIELPSGKSVEWPSNEIVSEGFGGGIKMCNHSDCFAMEPTYLPRFHSGRKGITAIFTSKHNKVRIKGQAQLNSDGDCEKYVKKWWKFWIK